MINYLFQLSNMTLFLLLSCISIAVSVIGLFVVKHTIPLSKRYQDNAGIGTTASLISVMYGVLAGLSALYLINNNSYTADVVQREANAMADVYRDSQWLQNPSRANIQGQIKNYITKVIGVEWPLMAQGSMIDEDGGGSIINNMTNELVNYSDHIKMTVSESLLIHDMLDEIRTLYDSRQQRIQMSYTALNPAIWVVIIIGTILTLCTNFLFGMNFYLHIFTVVAAALMTSSMIFLLIALDRPFQGDFVLEPQVFKLILAAIEKNKIPTPPF